MKIEFDPQKSQRNEYERGLPFHLAANEPLFVLIRVLITLNHVF